MEDTEILYVLFQNIHSQESARGARGMTGIRKSLMH